MARNYLDDAGLSYLVGKLKGLLAGHTTLNNNPHGVTAAQTGAVPTTRKVNSKALSEDITLAAIDVGAAPEPFYVMLSGNTTDGYTVDKTFAEITTAFSAGQDMRLLEYGSYMYQYKLVWAAGSSAVFACNKGEYSYVVTVKSDNTVTKQTYALLLAGHDYNINAHSDIREAIRQLENDFNDLTTENWTFTLEDGSTVTKAVYVG